MDRARQCQAVSDVLMHEEVLKVVSIDTIQTLHWLQSDQLELIGDELERIRYTV